MGKAPPVGGCEWFASPCAQRDGSLFRERSGSSCDEELTHSCNSGSRSCHGPLRRSGHEAVQLTDGRSCSHRNDSVLDSFCVTQCHSESDAMIFHTRGVSPTPGTLFYQVPPQVGNILSTFCRPRRRRRVRKNVLRLRCRWHCRRLAAGTWQRAQKAEARICPRGLLWSLRGGRSLYVNTATTNLPNSSPTCDYLEIRAVRQAILPRFMIISRERDKKMSEGEHAAPNRAVPTPVEGVLVGEPQPLQVADAIAGVLV